MLMSLISAVSSGFDVMNLLKIIFGKIYPLEMLFLSCLCVFRSTLI